MIVTDVEVKMPKTVPVPKINWRKGDFAAIRDELECTDWNFLTCCSDLNEAWNMFKNRLTALVDTFVPRKIMKGAGQPKWLTREIKTQINQKRKAWKRLRQEGGATNRDLYDRANKKLKKSIISAKRKVERNLAFSKDKNNRQFNQYIKSKTRARAPIGPLKKQDGSMAVEDADMAEELNRYFASVFTREDLTNIPRKNLETDQVLSSVAITAGKIISKIKNLRADSAAGPDGIHPRLLKETMYEVAEPLRIIFTRSLNETIVPHDWKSAVVTPIFKKGSRSDPGNYRPVSLTSVPCKILESIIKDEVTEHMEKNKLINESQHGFSKGKSCTTNVVEFLEVVTKAVDCGDPVDIFYLDFSKAFDKVPKERLMVKIRAKGVTGKLADWLQEWLTDRVQVVKVRNESSDEQKVESGVPQGTVMGPCLFKIHIDDLDDLIVHLVDLLSKFADDTKGAKIIKSIQDCIQLQEALNKLCEWAQRWGMAFNEKKCKIMHVGKNNPEHEYYMNGVRLAAVEEEKDVGVIVHKSLKPARQCEKAAATATGILMQLAKNFHYRDKQIFARLYTQYVRPHVEFATPVWSPWLQSDIKTIEKVQERAIKMMTGLKSVSYEDRCKEAGLETLENRRKLQDMAQTYKLVHGIDRIERIGLFSHIPAGRTRLAADPLNMRSEQAKTDIRKNFFTQRIVQSWNQISSINKNCKNIHAFKSIYRHQMAGQHERAAGGQ
jgi:Reverse transcriptase (RNA-dependent DNA polymerase)